MSKALLRAGFLVVALAMIDVGQGRAGPIGDFEADFSAAYADYRAALLQTNRNDKAATERVLGDFIAKWRGIATRWGAAPPPHMAEDIQWSATLEKVAALASQAQKETASGELPKAHDTLENIREQIGALRERNRQVTFSDRMNAYHAKMEHALGRDVGVLDAHALGLLREDAAVLAYLADDLERHAPPQFKNDLKFGEALMALKKSVSALVQTVQAGEAADAKKALQGLKGPYARMFLQFG